MLKNEGLIMVNKNILVILLILLPVFCSTAVAIEPGKTKIDLNTVGYVQVQCPVDGARIYFDRAFMGFITNGELIVPLDVTARPAHADLIIEYTGYQTFIGTLPDLVPGKTVGVSAELNATGYEKHGMILFEAGHPGAELFLNGVSKGTTPDSGILLIESVPSGLYEFTVKRSGNLTITSQQYVSSNALTVFRVDLQPAVTGEIVIRSTPEGADIYLNNRILGITPLVIPDLPKGTYEVRITHQEYQDWTGQITVTGGGTTSVDAVLVTIPPTPTPSCPDEPVTATPLPSSSQIRPDVTLYAGAVVLIGIIGCIVLGVWLLGKNKKE